MTLDDTVLTLGRDRSRRRRKPTTRGRHPDARRSRAGRRRLAARRRTGRCRASSSRRRTARTTCSTSPTRSCCRVTATRSCRSTCEVAGKSEGEWTAFVNDPDDCHDAVEWVAAQDWSTGRVGMTGLSYMGWVQWAAASRRPPHLTCLVSTSAAGRWQQEIPYTNGAFQLYFAWWTYATRRRIPEGGDIDWERVLSTLPYGDLGEFINGTGGSWEMFSQHDRLDDTWKAIRFDDRYSADRGPLPARERLVRPGGPARSVPPLREHESPNRRPPPSSICWSARGATSARASRPMSTAGSRSAPDAALDMDAEHVRWFDHWLKGAGPGIEDVARVRVFEPGRNRWRHESRWPLSERHARSVPRASTAARGCSPMNPAQRCRPGATATTRSTRRSPGSTSRDIRWRTRRWLRTPTSHERTCSRFTGEPLDSRPGDLRDGRI